MKIKDKKQMVLFIRQAEKDKKDFWVFNMTIKNYEFLVEKLGYDSEIEDGVDTFWFINYDLDDKKIMEQTIRLARKLEIK